MQGRGRQQRDLLDVESVAGHLLKPGSVFAFLAEHRRRLFPDELFADLFPSGRGRPSVPADVVASVIVLQALHGLSDAGTVDEVTFDLRWKAACGLAVTAAGFHSTTLTYWRRRLAASDRPNRIFDAVKAVVAETGALAGKTRRALDSTVLDDAVATQDTVIQLIAAIRRVRREVPGAAGVVAARCSAHDYDDPGKPAIAWNDQAAREQLVDGLVRDALAVLDAIDHEQTDPRAADALALLALIAGQDVELVDEGADPPRWRIAQRVAADRVISVVDPESRHAHKTVHRRQDGFKAHVAVEPDTGIITDCRLTKAAGAENHDAVVGLALLDSEASPLQVLADSAYGTGDARAALRDAGHEAVIKPLPLRAPVPGGFTIDDFTIDFAAGTVTCPAGNTKHITKARNVVFDAACRGCPLRSRCTTAKDGRSLKLHEHETLLRAARRQAETPEFQTVYRQHRPMVERSIAWLTRDNRKLRYRGVTKNDHWLHHRAAALNLRRLTTLGLTTDHNGWILA
ncbi:MAG TPA: IS1182 family transposase [Pseudonocardiaceae bacterium]|nr:IS1182 family transposase [Pseudonocardiaceae bacterium]